MERREILWAIPIYGGALFSGCLQEPAGETTPENTPETNDTQTRMERDTLEMRINNKLSREVTVTVTISSSKETTTEEELLLSAGCNASVETGISEPGTYEILIVADSYRDTSTVSIEDYDIENSLDFVVEIFEGDIRTILQE